MLLQHPESECFWDDWLITRYASLAEPPTSFDEAVRDLISQGYFEIPEESIREDDRSSILIVMPLHSVRTTINDGIERIATEARRTKSPYFTKEEAAVYLKTTVDGIYSRVERGHLKRCPGVRDYLFTQEMLDESVMVPRKRRGTR